MSSSVMIRSCWTRRPAAPSVPATSALSRLVLPDEVAPLINTLHRASTTDTSSAATSGSANSARARRRTPNRRNVRQGPSTATGGITAHTREPSARRASTIGDSRSSRRPSGARIRSMRRGVTSASSRPARTMVPSRSIHTSPPLLTITSLTPGSARNRCRGPRPQTCAKAASASMAMSASVPSGNRRRAPAVAASTVGAPTEPSPASPPASSVHSMPSTPSGLIAAAPATTMRVGVEAVPRAGRHRLRGQLRGRSQRAPRRGHARLPRHRWA